MGETRADSAPAEAAAPASVNDNRADRNPIFELLVSGDNDIVGLLAYSIYKQNKRDWLIAFSSAKGREPTEDEKASYIIGDSTPRRLATFRHLAQSTLEGRGPETPFRPGQGAGSNLILPRPAAPDLVRDKPTGSSRLGLIALAVVAVIAVYLAARFGLPGIAR